MERLVFVGFDGRNKEGCHAICGVKTLFLDGAFGWWVLVLFLCFKFGKAKLSRAI